MKNEVKLTISGDSAMDRVSRQTETLTSKIKQHWLGLSAGVAAAAAVMYKSFDFISLGAKAQQAEESFHLVAESFYEDANRIIEDMKWVSSGAVDYSDIMASDLIVLDYDTYGSVRVEVANKVSGYGQ